MSEIYYAPCEGCDGERGHYACVDVWVPCECCDGTGGRWLDANDQEVSVPVCHTCGAVVDADALAVQRAADGTPKLDHWLCRAHLVAGTRRLLAAMRAQEGQGA